MLNDRSTPLTLLQTRRSGKPRDMKGPGPTPAELEQILTIAARAPDHGKLAPWRFVVIEDGQRDSLAALFRQALAAEDPGAGEARHAKEDQIAHYPGTLVVLLSSPTEGHKVPVWEQQLSCGAAGMSLLLAAHALGYVAGWVTGWRAYSPRVTQSLGRPGEKIAGFIFIGMPDGELEERPTPALGDVVRSWTPEN